MSKSKNIEMITGDPKKAIIKLAVPMMISMLLIMLYNIADSVWVAGLGGDALSLIARNIGAKNHAQANNAALHAIVLSVIVSVVFTILIEAFMVPILKFMGAGSTIGYAMNYSYIIFGFLLIFVYSGVASAIFRSEGDMRRATIAIAITAILNIILDPIFIYVLNFGIEGAAWATVISATLSCIIMSYWIWGKKDLYLDLSPKNFSYSSKIMIDTLQVAIPSTLETIIFSALAIIINSMLVVASGTDAVAVYTASMRIVQLAMIPLIGIGTAVLTVAGVAYGAHNYKNLQTAHSYSIKIGFAISVLLGLLMFIFSSQIAAMFSYTEASAVLAPEIATAISVLSLFVLAIPHGIMSSMMFQGVGKGTYSLLITLLRSLILETVFAYIFCFIFGWGVVGIYSGVIIGCFVGGTIGYIWAKFFIRKFREISIRKYGHKEE